MPNIQQVASQPEPTQATKPEPEPKPKAPAPALPPQPPSSSLSLNLQPHPVPAHSNPLNQPPPSLQQQNISAAPPSPSFPPQFNLPSHFPAPPVAPGGNFNQPPLQPPMSQQPRMQVPAIQQHFSNQMMMMMPNSGIGFQPSAVSGPGMPPRSTFLVSFHIEFFFLCWWVDNWFLSCYMLWYLSGSPPTLIRLIHTVTQ